MTGAERNRRWRANQRKKKNPRDPFAGPPVSRKRVLNMRLIIDTLRAHPIGWMTATEMYRKVHAERDTAKWYELIHEIYHNQVHGDHLAPVTCIGSGKSKDAMIFRLSDRWDDTRDWDEEHAPDVALSASPLRARVPDGENLPQHAVIFDALAELRIESAEAYHDQLDERDPLPALPEIDPNIDAF